MRQWALTYETLGSLVKVMDGVVLPPSMQVAVFVELAALVVKSMRDLMPNHHTYAAIFHTSGKMAVVERGLQDSRRNHWEWKLKFRRQWISIIIINISFGLLDLGLYLSISIIIITVSFESVGIIIITISFGLLDF